MKRRQVFKVDSDDCMLEISIITKGDGRNHRSYDIDKEHNKIADKIFGALVEYYHFTRIRVG